MVRLQAATCKTWHSPKGYCCVTYKKLRERRDQTVADCLAAAASAGGIGADAEWWL